MASNWTFQSGASGQTNGASTAAVAVTVSPSKGDLVIASFDGHRATNQTGSGATIKDNIDTAGTTWTQIESFVNQPGNTLNTGAAWWKIAVGGETTVTATSSGGAGTINNACEVDVFRVPASYQILGVDLTALKDPSTAGTTTSVHSTLGSKYPSANDALAWTSISNGATSMGGLTGTNTFAGTSASANLTASSVSVARMPNQYLLGVQASATAGSNTFTNTWTSSVNFILFCATFVYGMVPPNQYPSYNPQIRASYW